MITPIEFHPLDFLDNHNERQRSVICNTDLSGAALIDNLILLRVCNLYEVQKVMQAKYMIPFAWVKIDPTPEEFKSIAEKHGVLIEKGRELVVYVPLDLTLDNSLLAIDIPNYTIKYKFIPSCNYKMVKAEMRGSLLSPHLPDFKPFLTSRLADFHPLLVFKEIILDCISKAGTDVHFESCYGDDKRPKHRIKYRVNRKLELANFDIDYNMMHAIIQSVIGKLTTTSAADLDSPEGVVTEVRDLFSDGSCDLRITGSRVDAGYYMVFTVQTVDTTTKTLKELGFPQQDYAKIMEISKRITGLTLVTGKMRTGKNTTIFAMLNEMDTETQRIIEYSNPIENHMSFPQLNYRGDTKLLKKYIERAKKQDIDIAVLNEIPNSEVAFAVRDLVNSAVCVITTTHIDRVWHLPYKLDEFFGSDYKTIVSQLNAVINHKMFRLWHCERMQKRAINRDASPFEKWCANQGVRQYFVPEEGYPITYTLQPLTEILIITDEMKSAMVNFDEIWRAENMLQHHTKTQNEILEKKVASYINEGKMALSELRQLYRGEI